MSNVKAAKVSSPRTVITGQHKTFLDQRDGRAAAYNIIDAAGSFVNGLSDEEMKELVLGLREESASGFDRLVGMFFHLALEEKVDG